jgi:hypothetical protein
MDLSDYGRLREFVIPLIAGIRHVFLSPKCCQSISGALRRKLRFWILSLRGNDEEKITTVGKLTKTV